MKQNTKELKADLRKVFKAKRRELDIQKKDELDYLICKKISELECFKISDTLLLYSPVNGEINLGMLADMALIKGKRIAYPLCNTSDCTMTFKYVSSRAELISGAYSIPEPKESAETFKGGKNVICIVPALTFDKFGFRLGYGKGYYDRFLKNFDGISLGAIYQDFLCDTLPHGYYDVSVDILVSEEGKIKTDAF